MLVKKYLESLPLGIIDASLKKKKMITKLEKEFVSVSIHSSEKHGEIYSADFFDKDYNLIRRFFSDGKNHITFFAKGNEWSERQIYETYTREFLESKNALEITKHFFNETNLSRRAWGTDTTGLIVDFITESERAKRDKYQDNKYKRMQEHLKMFPDTPKGIEKYCDEFVFSKRYVVIKKPIDKKEKKSKCKCLHCGKGFTSKVKLKHKEAVVCPKCNSQATAIAERYIGSLKDKTRICFFHRVNGNLLKEWNNVERRYSDKTFGSQYTLDTYYCELSIASKVYRYKWSTSLYTYGFTKTKYSNHGDTAHIYADNMKEVFDRGFCMKMNMERLRYAGEIDIEELFAQAVAAETTWQLYKIGLYRLACVASLLSPGESFQEVLGLSKNYLPSFKKYNLRFNELKVVKMADCFLKDESIGKLCRLMRNQDCYDTADSVKSLLKKMTFEKMVNYFTKQLEFHPKKSFSTMATWYNDYITMAKELNNKLPKKKKFDIEAYNFKYPRDIKKAHDNISDQLTIKENAPKERALKKQGQRLEKTHSFSYKEMKIVIPSSIGDFIREGNVLSHCVGKGSNYIDQHLKGTALTFFIRKAKDIDKPYYTFTIKVDSNTIKECYGKCHAIRTKEISEFMDKFLEHIMEQAKPSKSKRKVA